MPRLSHPAPFCPNDLVVDRRSPYQDAAYESGPVRVGGILGDETMAVDGNWKITLSTPLGDRDATLMLKSDGGTLTGTQAADGHEADIMDGTVNGNDLAWKAAITNPMPLTLAFAGKVDGDKIAGDVSIGPMGSFPFTGSRA